MRKEWSRRLAAGLAACMLLLGSGCARDESTRAESGGSTAGTAGMTSSTAVPAATAGTTDQSTVADTGTTTAAAATTTVAATTAGPADDREAVRQQLTSGRIAAIYKTTYTSLFSRLNADGYFQESVTGRYKGEYVRSIGALVKLALEAGDVEAAQRALRFVTDTMTAHALEYFPFTISADKKTVRREDELDGRAHFVLGWALTALAAGPSAYEDETYEMVAREMDAFFSEAYRCSDADSPAFGLLFNDRFTHTRMKNGEDYWHCWDTLTNHFAAAAAENLIAVARRRGDNARADRWQGYLDDLAAGIRRGLTRTADGKTVYLELLNKGTNGPEAETGMSWVCLSPVAAEWSGLDLTILANTADYMYRTLWKEAAGGGYLACEGNAAGKVNKDWILGKSVGWDIEAARLRGDWGHIRAWFGFLETNHTGDLFMEKMKKSGSKWKVEDAGNGEQCIWFVWALARLRKELGLPVAP